MLSLTFIRLFYVTIFSLKLCSSFLLELEGDSRVQTLVNHSRTAYLVDLSLRLFSKPGSTSSGTLLSLSGPSHTLDLHFEATTLHARYTNEQIKANSVSLPVHDEWRTLEDKAHWSSIRLILSRTALKLIYNHNFKTQRFLSETETEFLFYQFSLGSADGSPATAACCVGNMTLNQVPLLPDLRELDPSLLWGQCHLHDLDACSNASCPANTRCELYQDTYHCVVESQAPADSGVQADRGSSGGGGRRPLMKTEMMDTLVVNEGESVPLNLNQLFNPDDLSTPSDLAKLDIDPKHLWLNVTWPPPEHGLVIGRRQARRVGLPRFQLERVNEGNILYQHDGSESTADKIILQPLERNVSEPVFTLVPLNFFIYLPVAITPVNDKPTIYIDWTRQFLVEAGSSRPLTEDTVHVHDGDNQPSQVTVYVLSFNTKISEVSLVNVEAPFPDQPITSFTWSELRSGAIHVNHSPSPTGSGLRSVNMDLQVADIESFGNKSALMVDVVDIDLHVINNRLVTLATGTPFNLSNYHLSIGIYPDSDGLFISADEGRMKHLELKVLFSLAAQDSEAAASIQRLDQFDRWVPVTSFTQGELRSGRVRLMPISADALPKNRFSVNGAFDMVASYRNMRKSLLVNYVLSKPFITVHTNAYFTLEPDAYQRNFTVDDIQTNYTHLSPVHSVPPTHIYFSLVAAPSYGDIQVWEGSLAEGRGRSLVAGQNFTFQQLAAGQVSFVRGYQALAAVSDTLRLVVDINGIQSDPFSFKIHVLPIKDANFRLRYEPIEVMEGGQTVITTLTLDVSCSFSDNFFFYIDAPRPAHGRMDVIGSRQTALLGQNKLIAFTYAEVKLGAVSYVHDGSESSADVIMLSVAPITTPRFQDSGGRRVNTNFPIYNISFPINVTVIPVSDQKPVVLNNRILNVTRGGVILITRDLLSFTDPDVNEADGDVQVIVSYPLVNADFIRCSSYQVLQQFFQRDIDNDLICLRHRGEVLDAFSVIEVSGSKGERSDDDIEFLDIRVMASDAYLEVTAASSVQMQRESQLTLSEALIAVRTNLYLNPYSTFYRVQQLSYGQLLVNTTEGNKFFQNDLLRKRVAYRHTSSVSEVREVVKMTLVVGSYSANFQLEISIRDDLQAPSVDTLSELLVREQGSAPIDRGVLEVTHPELDPAEIRYLVVESPKFGSLVWKGMSGAHQLSTSLNSFTQLDLNSGSVSYVNTRPSPDWADAFAFNVSTGRPDPAPPVSHTLRVHILPKDVRLVAEPVSIHQSGSFVLGRVVSLQPEDFYMDIDMTVIVSKPPLHGSLHHPDGELVSSGSLLVSDLESVTYFHDGDDSSALDLLILRAENSSLGIRTDDLALTVNIRVVDKYMPVVVTPTEWKIVNGQSCVMTNQILSATDRGSVTDNLRYLIKSNSSGYVTLRDDLFNSPISNFTQRQINNGQIVFNHQYNSELAGGGGGSSGFAELIYAVSDGTNVLLDQYLRIFPQPLQLLPQRTNDVINLHPGVPRVIQPGLLRISTNDDCSSDYTFTYTLLNDTSFGHLQVANSLRREKVFTSAQLARREVAFFPVWSGNYSWPTAPQIQFAVEVKPGVRPITVSLTLNLDFRLTYSPEAPSALLTNRAASVYRNEVSYLSDQNLDASNLLFFNQVPESITHGRDLLYVIIEPPKLGHIGFGIASGDIGGTKKTQFTQEDISNGLVYYNHTSRDAWSKFDSFSFNVTYKGIERAPQFLGPVFNLTIINRDHWFARVMLVTQKPVVRVVQSYHATVNHTHLLADDADTPAHMIEYHVLERTTRGYFADFFELSVPVAKFTQKQLNDNRVVFVSQSDSMEPFTVDMRVQDLISPLNPNSKVPFTLTVQPVQFNLELGGSGSLKLEQASWKVAITSDAISASTNADPSKIYFRITMEPRAGSLLVDNQPITMQERFSQAAIVRQQISYNMNRRSDVPTTDNFTLLVGYYGRESSSLEMRLGVEVVPLFSTAPVYVLPGDTVTLTRAHLATGRLTHKTSQATQINVLQRPRYGDLYNTRSEKMITNGGFFLDTEIMEEVIEYRANNFTDNDIDTLNDEATISVGSSSLYSNNVFPASQFVKAKLALVVTTTPWVPTLPGGAAHNNPGPNKDKDFIAILIPIVLFIILFSLIGVFLVRRQQRKKSIPSTAFEMEKSPKTMTTPVEYSKNGMFAPLPAPFEKYKPQVNAEANGSRGSLSQNSIKYQPNGTSSNRDTPINLSDNSYYNTGGGYHSDHRSPPSPTSNPQYPLLQTERSCAVPQCAVTRLKRHVPHVDPKLMTSDPAGGGAGTDPSGTDFGGYEWGGGGTYSDDSSGYRDSPPNHPPNMKAVVRVDSRGHVETRAYTDQYPDYRHRPAAPNYHNSLPSGMVGHPSPATATAASPGSGALRQSQYWL